MSYAVINDWCVFFLQTLDTDSLGQVTNFEAVPGFGICCQVSSIAGMIQSKNRSQILTNNSAGGSSAEIDGLGAQSTHNSSLSTYGMELQAIGGFYTERY